MASFTFSDFPHTRHIAGRGRLNFSRDGRIIVLDPSGSDTISGPAEFIPTFYVITAFANVAGFVGQKGTVKLDFTSGTLPTVEGTDLRVTIPQGGKLRVERTRAFVPVDKLDNTFALAAVLGGGLTLDSIAWELSGALTASLI